MRNGKICHFYVNPAIRDDETGNSQTDISGK